jgi:hypothetical protein
MRLRTAAVAAAGLLALAAAGCASADQTGSNQAGSGLSSGTAVPSSTSNPTDTTTGPSMGGPASTPVPTSSIARAVAGACPADPGTALTNPRAKPVPANLKVGWVLRCRVVPGIRTNVVIGELSTSDPTDLVRGLREPSMPRQKVVCPMLAPYIPYFALVEPDGQVFVPRIPLNNCGMPLTDVVSALNSMQFTQVTSRPVK